MILKWNNGRVVKLAATQCFLASDVEERVLSMLERHANTLPVLKLGVVFCNQFVPVSTPDEVRLACVLVCAHHNELVRGNVGDATYGPYMNDVDYESKRKLHVNATEDAKTHGWAVVATRSVRKDVGKDVRIKRVATPTKTAADQWDEELHGERVVYDETFEMNEDLVPWNMERHTDWAIEKYGYYI